jgi:hypothetical protein
MSDIPPVSDDSLERFCPDCGYDLRGIASQRCPECGLAIDSDAILSRIPWHHRARTGWLRAFRRTLLLATFRPRRLAGASTGPVDFSESEYFRRLVVGLASLPLVAALLVVIHVQGGSGFLSAVGPSPLGQLGSAGWFPDLIWQLKFIWSAGATLATVGAVAIILMLALCTAASKYWFRPASLPSSRQNRAVAISGYACAPLAWLFVPGIAALGFNLQSTHNQALSLICGLSLLLFYLSLPVVALLWWWDTLRMMVGATNCGLGRVFAVGALLPVTWAICAAVALGIFPALVGFLWVMIDSLRP